MTGGSIGFQIGLQGVDLVMMIMNDRGMQALLTNGFKVAPMRPAAGPVGRHVEGSTDWKLGLKCSPIPCPRSVCRH